MKLGLLDENNEIERRRNIVTVPDWEQGSLSEVLTKEFYERLTELPELPAKFLKEITSEISCLEKEGQKINNL